MMCRITGLRWKYISICRQGVILLLDFLTRVSHIILMSNSAIRISHRRHYAARVCAENLLKPLLSYPDKDQDYPGFFISKEPLTKMSFRAKREILVSTEGRDPNNRHKHKISAARGKN